MSAARILLVEDDAAVRDALSQCLSQAGHSVETAADAHVGLSALHAQMNFDLVISDVKMSPMDGFALMRSIHEARLDVPVMLLTAFGSIDQAVSALQAGACDYVTKPIEMAPFLSKVERWVARGQAVSSEFTCGDDRTHALLQLARRVAGSDVSVMISGPSGAGKEVMARYIHTHSRRKEAPFVAINCAAIPENMLEAVLFGYEKGAYTGAHKSMPGKFEQAQYGTLLLDEISEMDLGLQAKLLRVIQEREVERLGGRESIALDVRILATTNRSLQNEVTAGRFREDLYYRLNVFPVRLPPLIERKDDIEPLARLFVDKHAGVERAPKRISRAAIARLEQHRWPGNVRELENVVQRALVLADGAEISVADVHFEDFESGAEAADGEAVNEQPLHSEIGLGNTLKSRESELIMDTLRRCRGSRKGTAEALGISPRTLRYKLSRMREQGYRIPEAYGYSAD